MVKILKLKYVSPLKNSIKWNKFYFYYKWLIKLLPPILKLFTVTLYALVKKFLKGTGMQIEKTLINDPLGVSKLSWKFCIPTIYNFRVI